MIEQHLGISSEKLILSITQTFYMLGIGLFVGALIGIPLGILLVVTRKNGIARNDIIFFILNGIVNIIRSIPFIILLVFIMPLTRVIVGTTIGTSAALVPLIIYISPYIARLVESSLLEIVDAYKSDEFKEYMEENNQGLWYIPEELK